MTNTQTQSPIAILTDFGTSDIYVGVMKGVILKHNPAIPLIDLTHDIPPQDVRQGAFALWLAYRYFPARTVFLVVVDPGVGTARHPIAVQAGPYAFIAPDNGVLGDVLAELGDYKAVSIDPQRVNPALVTATFHGRDLFAPAAARLASGTELDALGTPLKTLVTLPPPHLSITPAVIEGEIIAIDHFGNAATSIGICRWTEGERLILTPRLQPGAASHTVNAPSARVQVGPHTLPGITRTFATVPTGQAVALVNSAGQLEIAVNQGNARQQLGLSVGDRVTVTLPEHA